MKKLFGLFVLAMALVLSSCGSGFTDETGDVSFSIPGNQLVRMVASARDGKNGDIKGDVRTYKIAVLVQIMGSKGYYSSQVQETMYEISSVGNADLNFEDPNTVTISESPINNSIKDLKFSFPRLPVNQQYTIYLDVLESPEKEGGKEEGSRKWMVVYSGENKDIRIRANASNPVQIPVSSPNYNPSNDDIGFEVTYVKNGATQTKIFTRSEICGYSEYSNNNSGQISHKPTVVFSNVDGKVCFGGIGRTAYPVSDIKFVLLENSHFKRNGQVVIESESDENRTLLEKMKDATMYYTSPVIVYGDYIIAGNTTNVSFEIRGTSFGGGDNGYGQGMIYSFRKDTVALNRFYTMIPLKDILDDVVIQKGESIAFVLKNLQIWDSNYNVKLVKRNLDQNSDPGYDKFAYVFQKEENLPVEQRYVKNVTIDFEESDNINVIISGNFLTGEEKYLELFFDVTEGYYTANEILNSQFTVQYKIYSAEEKAYVFHSSYYDTTSRYEMIYPLNDILPKKPAGGDTVKITLSGKVERPFWGTSNPSADDNKVFRSEFFDNASYKNDPTDLYATDYHPLSQEDAQGNDPIIDIDSDGKFTRPFTFASIKAPGTPDNGKPNDFRFQCYNELNSSVLGKLLVIRDFDISVKIQ